MLSSSAKYDAKTHVISEQRKHSQTRIQKKCMSICHEQLLRSYPKLFFFGEFEVHIIITKEAYFVMHTWLSFIYHHEMQLHQ